MFPGAAVEVSSSGRALHIIGTGKSPAHRSRNTELHLEFYTQDRWVALTGTNATGDAIKDHTAAIAELVTKYFLPSEEREAATEWADKPRPEWHGPEDDDVLIDIAMRSRKGQSSKAKFKDLYEMNVDKLSHVFPPDSSGQAFNASSADLSLANALAYWTGNHGERMERIMRRSELTRGKWDRPDYIRRTILKACAATQGWYNDGKRAVEGEDVPVCSANLGIGLDDFHAYLPQHMYIFVSNPGVVAGLRS